MVDYVTAGVLSDMAFKRERIFTVHAGFYLDFNYDIFILLPLRLVLKNYRFMDDSEIDCSHVFMEVFVVFSVVYYGGYFCIYRISKVAL